MNRYKTIRSIALLGGTILGCVATAARADSGDAGALQEVIVTAQKRAENIQEVPIAITAFDSKSLETRGVTDTDSFAKGVPNLHIKQGTTGVITIAIRGVSNNDPGNPGYENAVGMYVDGVYAGKAVGSLFDLDDVERVEVLRGPQGTLYGRNTIGGAVNLISKRPTGELGGTLKLGVGNENLRTVNGSLDLPAFGTEGEGFGTIKTRLSYFIRKRDGFTDNVQQNYTSASLPVANFSRFGDVDRKGFHGAIDWQVRDNFSVAYDYSRFRANDSQRLLQVIDVVRPGSMPIGFEDYIPHGQPGKGSANEVPFFDTDMETHALTATWDVTDVIALKSITGYRKIDSVDGQDLDGSNVKYYESARDYKGDQFSQELQLIGTTAQLKYVVGLYYFDEQADSLRVQQFATLIRNNNAYMENKNQAVFGQVDYTPEQLDKLTLSLGGRYTREKKAMDRYLRNVSGGGGSFTVVDPGPNLLLPTLEFSNTSYMFSPSYRISDELNVYAKYAEGFRSGGYDGSSTTPASAAVPFQSEELKTYEVGLKSRWLDNRLELNVAAFYSDYSNMQLSSFNGIVAATLNAGRAKLDGVELESKALLTERLQASLSLSYLHYEFDKFDMGPVIGDVSDRARLNNAPASTANFALDYDFPSLGFGDLSAHLNYNYSAAADAIAIQSNGAAPNSSLSSRGLLDARLTLSNIRLGGDSRLQFSLWGMNLTNTEYYDNVIDFGGFRGGTLGWPRTYGAEATFDF